MDTNLTGEYTAELLYNGHHWDQRFVLYSEVSFAQGVIADYAPLTIVVRYAGARLWTMKSVVVMKDLLLFSPSTRIKDISGLLCNYRSLILTDINGGCG